MPTKTKLKGYGVPVLAKAHVSGYTRKDGVTVAPHEDKRHAKYAALFKHSLGKRRDDMPQVPNALKQRFLDGLTASGISVERAMLDPRELKPTQADYNAANMDHLTSELEAGRLDEKNPIIVSSDGRVLDGHHRWAVLALAGRKVSAIRVGMPMERLLLAAEKFHGDHGIERRSATGAPDVMTKAVPILLVKARVGAYLRNGKLVNLQGYNGRNARAMPHGDQLSLFARPQSSMRMDVNPYKDKDPVLDTIDLFSGKTQREEPTRVPEAPDELIREHKRLVAVLRSPSHKDDLKEADRQEAELREYERGKRQAGG